MNMDLKITIFPNADKNNTFVHDIELTQSFRGVFLKVENSSYQITKNLANKVFIKYSRKYNNT